MRLADLLHSNANGMSAKSAAQEPHQRGRTTYDICPMVGHHGDHYMRLRKHLVERRMAEFREMVLSWLSRNR